MNSEHSHDLFNPYFQFQGGELFLIGIVPEGATDSGWNTDKVGTVKWSLVTNYYVFEDLDSYSKACEISENFSNSAKE